MTSLSDRLKATRRDEIDQTPQSATATGTAATPRDDRNATPGAVTAAAPAGRSGLRLPEAGNDALVKLKDRAASALFERLGARLNDPSLSESQLHALVRSDLNQVVEEERVPLTSEQRHRLIRDVEDDVLGHGPLQRLLDDPRVTEIMVNGPDMIYVEQDGKLVRSSAQFTSEGPSAADDRAHRIPGRAAHRRVIAPGRRPARRRVPGQRDHPAAGLQRLLADHPQVREGPVQGRGSDRFRNLDARRWPSCCGPASRRG